MWPPEFMVHLDNRDIPIGDIEVDPIIPLDQRPLLDIDKYVRSEYSPKHNPDMG